MILYSSTKKKFRQDVSDNIIDREIHNEFIRQLGRRTSPREVESWKNSSLYMSNALDDEEIPDDVGVSIEYKIPQTSKRIDFIITGGNPASKNSAVIVELKQWTEASKTNMDGVVTSFVGGAARDLSHPSYQAWVYASCLEDFNEAIEKERVALHPCAYLHNCIDGADLIDPFYDEYLAKAPLFLRADAQKLKDFIKTHVKYGDKKGLMYKIEGSKIRPSKKLADTLAAMLSAKQEEFHLIDDQKVVFENALRLARSSTAREKRVMIVEGGPGSGKSVVAINLLVRMIQLQLNAQYVTKNSAPREVYSTKLTGTFGKSHIKSLFVGSGGFTKSEKNIFDSLIVDEAHRLNEKSGLYSNMGENQIKEIIDSSKFSVFFIDEDQKVTLKDVGSKAEIEKWAKRAKAEVLHAELSSQFRCGGSDGYISWLDDVLRIKTSANQNLEGINYDFRVFDDVSDLHHHIREKNTFGATSRTVAGYCWDWKSKKDSTVYDIKIGNFLGRWNLTKHGGNWIIHPESVDEIGCIHTCQGLEVDYIGVIIGPDFIVRGGEVVTDGFARSSQDQSIKGFKKLHKEAPKKAKLLVDSIIKNTYRTLMSRGLKGCYLYCTDPETNQYFKQRLG